MFFKLNDDLIPMKFLMKYIFLVSENSLIVISKKLIYFTFILILFFSGRRCYKLTREIVSNRELR